ncbi:MAG: hypothetical protein HKO63_05435 [Acidimicrobiia bacterium]|nr:hypothetical protein [Acidimicrobiia bacterium]MBT8191821.1 hypothetical protein [Acidimicrobiia bacterium]MBT8246898.1 hypothetical protein [Acidimicrobiia bacterium]NNF89141.1 hypothetical protein [Acidimicrobiia bacterium]NNJ48563.1 hypothetical protein [Acidimicrobiia bacterium]
MKRLLAAITVFAFGLGILAISGSAFATNSMMGDFTSAYPATAGTPLASCSTCHTSVPALNPYGAALRSNSFNFGAIEGLDSDGDGVSNMQEIQNLTNPGVAQAAPTTTTTVAARTSTTVTTAPTPSSTTSTTMVSEPGPATPTTTTVTTEVPSTADGISRGSSTDAMPFSIGGVGTVWLAIEDGRLVILEVDTTWAYTLETEDDEIEIEFRSGSTEVEFEAELEDGAIETGIEMEVDDDDEDHDDDDDRDDRDDDDDDDD